MGLTQVTEPSELPLTLEEVKHFVRIDDCSSEDNALLWAQMNAAVDWAQKYTQQQFVTATWELTLGDFPAVERGILLPYPPLQSVESITYVDVQGNTQTLSSSKYNVITTSPAGFVEPAYGELWPNTRPIAEAVTIRYKAGFGESSAVPETIKIALKMLVAHWFDMRSPVSETSVSEVPITVQSLLDKYQIREVV